MLTVPRRMFALQLSTANYRRLPKASSAFRYPPRTVGGSQNKVLTSEPRTINVLKQKSRTSTASRKLFTVRRRKFGLPLSTANCWRLPKESSYFHCWRFSEESSDFCCRPRAIEGSHKIKFNLKLSIAKCWLFPEESLPFPCKPQSINDSDYKVLPFAVNCELLTVLRRQFAQYCESP